MRYQSFSPPGGEGDDPRTMLWVCVDDLQIDPVVQRPLQFGSPVWKQDWDWSKAEVVTLADRNGTRYVIEGQNRVERLKKSAPGTWLWAVLAGSSGREAEAATALGITRGRRRHSPVDLWKLAVEAGSEHEVIAEDVLAEFGLSMTGSASGRMGIAAVTSVSVIIHSGGKTPAQGAAMLEKVLTVITGAFGPDDDKRFEAAMLRGVADIFETNRTVDIQRLIRAAGEFGARRWLRVAREVSSARAESNQWQFLAKELIDAYNRNKRKDKLVWSREAR